jgi:TMP repeat
MDKRTEFVERLSAQIIKWDIEIDRLKGQAENATGEEKIAYSKTVSALQLKRDQAAEKLQGIGMVSEDEWEDIKTAAEQIWDEIKGLLKNVIKKTG